MNRWSVVGGIFGSSVLLIVAGTSGGCGNSSGSQFNGNTPMFGGSSSSGTAGGTSGGFGGTKGGGDAGSNPNGMTAGAQCPSGAQCNVSCPAGQTTTVSGTVHDPAGMNPLYGISVYVPGAPLQPLPAGVPTGADACSCAALYKSGAITSTTTDVNGEFTLQNVPVGSNIPLVIQVGKWRHVTSVTTTACNDNKQPDASTALNATVAAGSQDSMPDIAVSTGGSDTLECLMKRIGLPDSEYVAGSATGGHVHIFSGGAPAANRGLGGGIGAGGVGNAEANPMPNAPASDMALWDSAEHLMAYDILLLSCEGGETYDAKPANLEQYLNAGGRAFASHFHYAWFSDKLSANQGYAAPADWGANLATWTPNANNDSNGPDDGVIVQTLNVGGGAFVKGQMLAQWLGGPVVNALGQNGVPAGDLSIYSPRYNAVVGPTNVASQPWITDSVTSGGGGQFGGGGGGRRPEADASQSATTDQTMYFSFDTPVGTAAPADGGEPNYCGRAVFSDLHVSGNTQAASGMDSTNVRNGSPPPQGCAAGELSPQEKALEFMLFDLSSCVVSDRVAPPAMVPVVN